MQNSRAQKKFFLVIESPEDLPVLSGKMAEDLENIRIFCTCSEASVIMLRKGLAFEPLLDDVLNFESDKINTWAKQASLSWYLNSEISEALTLNGINIGNLCNRPVSHCLIYQLKNYRLAQLIAERIHGEKFIFIRRAAEPAGDEGTVNEMLRHVLTQKPDVSALPRISSGNSIVFDPKRWIRYFCGIFFNIFFSPMLKKTLFVGAGTLKVILPVLERLNQTAQSVFVDESFQWESYWTCKRSKIEYRLASAFLGARQRNRLEGDWNRTLASVRNHAKIIENLPCFIYQGEMIPGLFERLFAILKKQGFTRLSWAAICKNLHTKHAIRACLLHEDIDRFRGFAIAARMLNIPAVVISHGIPATRSDWSQAASGIGIAHVVVNSDFEKDKYIMMGYEPEKLHVLGLPRYDYIYQRLAEIKNIKRKRKVVLYCPHMLTRITKRKKGYLGIHTPGGVTRQNSVVLFEAVKDIDCEVWVKPHGNSKDIHLWKELILREGSEKIHLVSHAADIFDLIVQCDLIVATFSTVVIEATLFQKNVITLNFTSEPDIHSYAQRGIAYGVYHPQDLVGAIRKCLFDVSVQNEFNAARAREMRYFGGPFDGSNTKRVVAFVEQLAKGQMPVGEAEKCPLTMK